MNEKKEHDHLAHVRTDISVYGKNAVLQSPFFEELMEKFAAIGSTMSIRKFWDEFVKAIDKDISYRSWCDFMRRFKASVAARNAAIIRRVEDRALTEVRLEDSTMRKVLALADVTMEDIARDPTALRKIDPNVVMRWFFQGMKARDSRVNVALKKREDDRKQSVWDSIMDDAQYGESKDWDAESMPDPPAPAPVLLPPAEAYEPKMPEAVKAGHEAVRTDVKTKKFSPEDL